MDVIVIDGGGTSTKFALFRNGACIKKEQLPSSHIMQVGISKMIYILKEGIGKLREKENTFLVFGLAGYGNDLKIKREIRGEIDKNFKEYNYYLTNDIELAYYSEFEKECGILLILGTGSLGCKFKNGEFIRTGGWGYLIGDEASGYYLGKELLREFTHQADCRSKKTLLYHVVRSYFKIENDYDIISISGNLTRTEMASLAKIVFYLYKNCDAKAYKIIEDMVDQSLKIIKTLIDEDVEEVVLFGGLTKTDIGLEKLISKKLGHEIRVRLSSNDALMGGYKLALDKFNSK